MMKYLITERQYKKILLSESTFLENRAKEIIDRRVENFKSSSSFGKRINNWIDGDALIDEFRDYLFAQIPKTLEEAKKGVGGQRYAYDSFKKIVSLVEKAFSNISWVKKNLIKAPLPKKEKFLDDLKNGKGKITIASYLEAFKEILALWIEDSLREDKELQKYQDNVEKYHADIWEWFYNNNKNINNEISMKVVDAIYS